MVFKPHYSITPETTKSLMAIEASRAAVDRLPISPQLGELARLLSTCFSTQIKGNRRILPEVKKVITGQGGFPDHARDAITGNMTLAGLVSRYEVKAV